MLLSIGAVLFGLIVLVWSADRFVDGAAATAKHYGMSALLIGMLIIGFGTSAPEIVVSILASMNGNPGLALGNGFGSNIANIALILGFTAVLSPIAVKSGVLRTELPLLVGATLLVGALMLDFDISRLDAAIMLAAFLGLMGYSIVKSMKGAGDDGFVQEVESGLEEAMPIKKAIFWVVLGLVLLVASSRLLVWGAIDIATYFGVSDLVIGLTVVAIGTSLPELAASVAAVRKNEHDLAIGNVIGSNLFNTLVVVGLAGVIHPLSLEPIVLYRDWVVMAGLTVSLFALGYGVLGRRRINRFEGALLLAAYIAYGYFLYISAVEA
ncbi:MAG: calcium/sodium antiporter [Pontibacterium sp.]